MEFQLQHQSFNEYSGLISFRMDWLDLLADQGTLKSLLQHHSSEASILQHSAFFIVQLSHPYMTTGRLHKRLVSVPYTHLRALTGLPYHRCLGTTKNKRHWPHVAVPQPLHFDRDRLRQLRDCSKEGKRKECSMYPVFWIYEECLRNQFHVS